MSEQDMTTRPTLETVVQMLGELRAHVDRRFDALDVRLDRMDSLAHETRSELLALRADFRELRAQLRDVNLVK